MPSFFYSFFFPLKNHLLETPKTKWTRWGIIWLGKGPYLPFEGPWSHPTALFISVLQFLSRYWIKFETQVVEEKLQLQVNSYSKSSYLSSKSNASIFIFLFKCGIFVIQLNIGELWELEFQGPMEEEKIMPWLKFHSFYLF